MNVNYAVKPSAEAVMLFSIKECTLESNLMNVMSVGKLLAVFQPSFNITELILGRNLMSVMNVKMPSATGPPLEIMREFRLEKNPIPAMSVGKFLAIFQ